MFGFAISKTLLLLLPTLPLPGLSLGTQVGTQIKNVFFLHVGCANTCLIRLESGLGEMGVFLVDANEKCKCLWIFFFLGGGVSL